MATGTRTRRLAAVSASLSGAVVAGLLTATPGSASDDGLDRVRAATARYHDVARAEADGFAVLADRDGTTCIDRAGDGAMGVHRVLGSRVGDPAVTADAPEVLVYAPTKDGGSRLVAVEWVVLAEAWHDAGNDGPPTLFRRAFGLVPEGNRYGLPAFYALHAWVWQHNPSGTFADYNPRVSC